MVRVTGLEPARTATLEPKSSASANSATPAQHGYYTIRILKSQQFLTMGGKVEQFHGL